MTFDTPPQFHSLAQSLTAHTISIFTVFSVQTPDLQSNLVDAGLFHSTAPHSGLCRIYCHHYSLFMYAVLWDTCLVKSCCAAQKYSKSLSTRTHGGERYHSEMSAKGLMCTNGEN